ncbi:MAG: Asp-tRNA(Asn)/Glu-tRNA(Gln) amidotransferase subunit GatA [Candidatus Ryanbacteria bacterium]|nr:Asp-tRNA(Asn)/Glu-tRNA(Gln) amidotransferase subunit GatA [Candidatus Ryanbacteria bacterium]
MIQDIHEKLVLKSISASELVEDYLNVIHNKNPSLFAFLNVMDESARHNAKALDQKIKKSEKLELLEGIPIAVKDNILIEGEKTTAGSKILENYTAAYDAFVIERLREAGTIFIGKTNLDEFAMGSSTENSAFGPTKNPHDPERVPGGSSGGSAAAVAAGMVPGALGSDTGGSIREPAAFCGIVGFKPSYGRVSRRGLIAMASSLDQIGTFGTTVEDAEILFRAIEGKDPFDMTSEDVRETLAEKKEYVLGVPDEFFREGLDKHIEAKIRESFKKAEGAGFKFEPVSLPHASYALAAYYIIMPAEVSSNLARFDGMRYGAREERDTLFDVYRKDRAKGFGLEVKRRIAIGTYVLSHGYYDAYYLQAQKVRTLIAEDFTEAFTKVDAIVAPTTPTLPFKFGEKTKDPLSMYLEDIYTVPANLAGLPAISLPLGKIENLPAGLQLIGKRRKDYVLLNLAKRYEKALES